ncbi:MAG: acyl-CoA thioesterase [Alcanivoracaceae bacterium]
MLTHTIRPRFCDTDALGHINNTVIPVWFLEAREPVLRMFAPDADLQRGGIAVVRVELDYLAETRFGEDVSIHTVVSHIGNSSFRLAQEVHQGDTVTARGLTTLVNFDARSRRAAPIPDDARAALQAHWHAASNEGTPQE